MQFSYDRQDGSYFKELNGADYSVVPETAYPKYFVKRASRCEHGKANGLHIISFLSGLIRKSAQVKQANEQKYLVSRQLNVIRLVLKQIQIPKECTFDGVGSEECKDRRRHTRISQKLIWSHAGFQQSYFL